MSKFVCVIYNNGNKLYKVGAGEPTSGTYVWNYSAGWSTHLSDAELKNSSDAWIYERRRRHLSSWTEAVVEEVTDKELFTAKLKNV